METAKKSFAAGQSPDEVARVILDCILSEKPYLRYQTSDKAREFTAAKLRQPIQPAIFNKRK
jgi:hypothetical protein